MHRRKDSRALEVPSLGRGDVVEGAFEEVPRGEDLRERGAVNKASAEPSRSSATAERPSTTRTDTPLGGRIEGRRSLASTSHSRSAAERPASSSRIMRCQIDEVIQYIGATTRRPRRSERLRIAEPRFTHTY
jgi:hypothetical protein